MGKITKIRKTRAKPQFMIKIGGKNAIAHTIFTSKPHTNPRIWIHSKTSLNSLQKPNKKTRLIILPSKFLPATPTTDSITLLMCCQRPEHLKHMHNANTWLVLLLNVTEMHVWALAKPIFFWNYTVQLIHSQCTHTHPYKHTYANPTPMSIFEDWAGKFSRLTKSP